jgi:hypothetical protein
MFVIGASAMIFHPWPTLSDKYYKGYIWGKSQPSGFGHSKFMFPPAPIKRLKLTTT